MTDQPQQDDSQVRPFADILRDLARGQLHDEAGIQLQSLVQAVQVNGKKGTLTLTIEAAPMRGDQMAVMLSGKVTAKPPAGELAANVFFADAAGTLVRDDPRQMHLPLREVGTKQPARDDLKRAT
jgi:hypothetical protein